jgi:hypothetical protein
VVLPLRRRFSDSFLFVTVVLCAARASAAAVPARYPINLRVKIAPQVSAVRYDHGGWGAISGPATEPSVTFAGKQAREAYELLAARLFQKDAAVPLHLEIESVRASVVLESDGWHTVVQHGLAVRDDAGAVLGRWSVEGRDRVQGHGEGALPAAFGRAAELAARRFESRFEEPGEVIAFLERAGVTPGAVARRDAGAERPLPPPTPPLGPPRAPLVAYLDAGMGVNPLSTSGQYPSGNGSSSSLAPGVEARLGLAGKWAFAQLDTSWWSSSDGNLDRAFTALGIEAGPLIRFASYLEVGLGGGLQITASKVTSYAYGSEPVWVRSAQTVPTVLAFLRFVPPIRSFRFRATLEGRLRFGSYDSAVVQGPFPSNTVDHLDAGQAFVFLIGGELPLRREAR